MATTNFSAGTVIASTWLNDVDAFVYQSGLPDIENVLYVAVSGNDSNSGLTALLPFATLQKAFDTIADSAVLSGSWKISIAAGVYSTASNRASRIGHANISGSATNNNAYNIDGVTTKNYIYIEGPDVGWSASAVTPSPTPTAIFDGGNAAAVGIQIEGPIKILIRNIKFSNYNGSSSSAGISGDGAILRCENVHADNCYYGISNSRGRLEIKGGILANCTVGTRSIFLNKHEIGNQSAGAAGQGPFYNTCIIGLQAQEGATGHSDYVSYSDCTDGVRVTVNSRVNYTGSDFKRCTRGLRADANSVLFASTATFNDGTVDACTENVVLQQGAVDVSRDAYSNSGLTTTYLGTTAVTITGTTTSTPVLQKAIARGEFCPNVNSVRKPQHIEFVAYGTMSGTAGTKQFKLRLGSTLLATITNAAADTGAWRCEGTVSFTDSNVQSANIIYYSHLTSIRVNTDTGTEDLAAAASSLDFEVQLSNAADSVTTTQAFYKVWG